MRLLSVIIFLINKNRINKYDDIYCDSKWRHQSDDDACLQTPSQNGRACSQPVIPTTTAHNGLPPPSYHSCPDPKKAPLSLGQEPILNLAVQLKSVRDCCANYRSITILAVRAHPSLLSVADIVAANHGRSSARLICHPGNRASVSICELIVDTSAEFQ